MFGSDLDVILQLIEQGDEENDIFDEQIQNAVFEPVHDNKKITCNICSKGYMTQSGLNRHRKSKRSDIVYDTTGQNRW